MKRNKSLIVLVLLLVAAPHLPQARAQSAPWVEGHVFLDTNGDGARQAEEPGIQGVTVQIAPMGELPTGTGVTDLLGYYLFENLAPGTYQVEAQSPAGYVCVRCQAEVEIGGDSASPVDLALALVVPWTPTPTTAPTESPTATPTEPPAPTETPLPTNTPEPPPTHTPAPTPTPGRPVVTFYAQPDETRFPGDCATLYWAVDRATEVFLLLPGGQSGVEGSGQRQVCPDETTTYRLKVNGVDGSQDVIDARVRVPPPPTNTPVPTQGTKPTHRPRPAATHTPAPTATATATLVPPSTPAPIWTPLPTQVPEVDPLLAGLPVRWGDVRLALPGDGAGE